MAKELQQLKKYYLLTDESIKKLRETEAAENQFSVLDHRLKKILYNNRLTGYNKFVLYMDLFNKIYQLRQDSIKKSNSQEKKTIK